MCPQGVIIATWILGASNVRQLILAELNLPLIVIAPGRAGQDKQSLHYCFAAEQARLYKQALRCWPERPCSADTPNGFYESPSFTDAYPSKHNYSGLWLGKKIQATSDADAHESY